MPAGHDDAGVGRGARTRGRWGRTGRGARESAWCNRARPGEALGAVAARLSGCCAAHVGSGSRRGAQAQEQARTRQRACSRGVRSGELDVQSSSGVSAGEMRRSAGTQRGGKVVEERSQQRAERASELKTQDGLISLLGRRQYNTPRTAEQRRAQQGAGARDTSGRWSGAERARRWHRSSGRQLRANPVRPATARAIMEPGRADSVYLAVCIEPPRDWYIIYYGRRLPGRSSARRRRRRRRGRCQHHDAAAAAAADGRRPLLTGHHPLPCAPAAHFPACVICALRPCIIGLVPTRLGRTAGLEEWLVDQLFRGYARNRVLDEVARIRLWRTTHFSASVSDPGCAAGAHEYHCIITFGGKPGNAPPNASRVDYATPRRSRLSKWHTR
ncbi:hypothetical protein CERZMDRAFT_81381 [Cercospora zeae-maydis SCOH1-5]|uniref:Uncharacterized protein n=1 Tax=Cercospora zeae-maydis SCOH1-5 TaxID=717836 RepID=A0A6A6FS17_9PEZI|nr:hypothetical protein CERZMDRAFT_81381 [Cercospora zeae-maydis SCOH1-5]